MGEFELFYAGLALVGFGVSGKVIAEGLADVRAIKAQIAGHIKGLLEAREMEEEVLKQTEALGGELAALKVEESRLLAEKTLLSHHTASLQAAPAARKKRGMCPF
jgi:hypothetical protein